MHIPNSCSVEILPEAEFKTAEAARRTVCGIESANTYNDRSVLGYQG